MPRKSANKNLVRCPKCGGGMVYLRLKKREFVCRQCGQEWPVGTEKVTPETVTAGADAAANPIPRRRARADQES